MKQFFSLIMLLLCMVSFSQELPDFTPPSPTPFELTKYGNVPINETSGKVTASIPIYNFQSGQLSVPIGLNYIGAGVKVDQFSSWTGINWNLNAGGVITRTVRDLPDEVSVGTNNRVLLDANDLNAMDLTIGSEDSFYLNHLEKNETRDTKADLFSFSFLNYSGSFYLDELYEPKLASYDQEIKIEFSGGVQNIDNQTIVITTKDGVKYRFGGAECEKTRIRHSSSPHSEYSTTAYYLYQIIHPLGDTINFEYGEESNNPFEIKFSQQEESTVVYGYNNSLCDSAPNDGYSFTNSFNRIYNEKYLTKISSIRSNVELLFNSEALNVYPHYKRRLNSISVINTTDVTNNQKITLDYIMDTSRFFLEDVKFLNYNNSENYKYSLEYDNPLDLPERFSFAKDHLGYYNGQVNNVTLLPTSSHYKFVNGTGGFSTLANRDPNIIAAKKGSLLKIHYPTKGFTNFEYEGTPVKVDQYTNVVLKTYTSLAQMYPNAHPVPDTNLEDHLDLQGDDLLNGLYKTQNVMLNITANAQGNINHHYKIRVKIKDNNSNQIVDSREYFLEHDAYQYSWAFETTLEKDKIYRVILELDPDPTSQSVPSPVDVKLSFRYTNGFNIEEGIGVRVKRVTDYASNNSIADTKRYYYDKVENVLNNSNYLEDYNYDSLYLSWNRQVNCCSFTGQNQAGDPQVFAGFPVSDWFHLVKLSSETVKSLFPSSDGLTYDNVTISYGGDNFEAGALEKTFLNKIKIYTLDYFSNYDNAVSLKQFETEKSNRDLFNGKVISEKFILNKNNHLYLNKVNNYGYEITQPEFIHNMQIKRLYELCTAEQNSLNSLNGVYIGFYKISVNKLSLASTESITYIEPVPINNLSNADNYENIKTSTNYDYDSYVGQPTKVTTTRSDINKVTETKNYYVNQIDELSGLTTNQVSAYDDLESSYRIENAIQTESYVTVGDNIPKLLSTQRTLYKNWNNGALVLPEYIQTAKSSNNLEDRITFHNYDNFGNLIEVSKSEGTRVRYSYNSQSLITKKVENPTSPTGTVDDSNSDISNCNYISLYPNSLITTYNYKNGTRLIESIKDPRCYMTYYEYDVFNRLKQVKDDDGNILSKNEYNYANQN